MFKIRNLVNITCKRYYSSKNVKRNSANCLRQIFLDYFIKENHHKFIRSSPVVPFCDPTVAFVNSGMNQFKNIFLGHQKPPASRVANSQKCIRVGGKHNDLNIVGTDGYHHTFFEMLGNWSFGDYFKLGASEMAWNLLTGPYGLKPSSLYVTYFGGDNGLGLPPDLEIKDIWRTIGVREDHIIPFGIADNFWEMGITGPCGPCTEIHFDHTNGENRQLDVNKGLSDLTELWNIVFIQFNRNTDGSISKLPLHHIDTGMGFERLVALIQGKRSNYDTDLFTPIFQGIQRLSKSPQYRGSFGVDDVASLDTSYRILADHCRMITACLADGMIPEENYKLRRVIRKVQLLGTRAFKQNKGFVREVCDYVIANLHETYPEMLRNHNQITNILEHEEELFQLLRCTSHPEWIDIVVKHPELGDVDMVEVPNLISGYKEIRKDLASMKKNSILPNPLTFKLYDTYGLTENVITKLADVFDMRVDLVDLQRKLKETREKTKQGFLQFNSENKTSSLSYCLKSQTIPSTVDSYKYDYEASRNSQYIFPPVDTFITGIVDDGVLVTEIQLGKLSNIIFGETCLYCEAGGQESDTGYVILDNNSRFKVNGIIKIQDCLVHNGILETGNADINIKVGDYAKIYVNENHRHDCMKNHTATHILHSSLKSIFHNSTITQKSSKVNDQGFRFDFNIFGEQVATNTIKTIEEMVCKVIKENVPVKTNIIDAHELYNDENVLLVPGEIYPEKNIRLVEIIAPDMPFTSREACCGTHVRNTSHIEDFCITSLKRNGRAAYSIRAVTGSQATKVRNRGNRLKNQTLELCRDFETGQKKPDILTADVKEIFRHLNDENNILNLIPFTVRDECIQKVNDISNALKIATRRNLRNFIGMEMESFVQEAKNTGQKWVVHFLQSSSIVESVSLQKATRVCTDLPIIVISYTEGQVKARCCVPKDFVTDRFNAQIWLQITVGAVFNGNVAAPKGQASELVCNMKAKKVDRSKWDVLLQRAVNAANTYASQHVVASKFVNRTVSSKNVNNETS